ncbi:ubiquitin-activating emzyme E1 [Histomonas meleagridis]|uniref:ubiquitin-activating emzyme E1 n=1 Tax=Histomonas meleagridis TaxID=135588 RepID=UPI00355986BD|nr:ubiquitin-activating emzyme E1 [Histomonas meleagridis]KAH0799088.1 ubiquitin-activating emzyme E1 [Histomonas meleagridis]
MGGLGVEIAKNVILAGVKSVTVNDTKGVEMIDLGSQFYLKESDIGKNRAECSLPQLIELNPYVSVAASQEEDIMKIAKNFNTIVVTEPLSEKRLIELSEFCHSNGICFISTEARGVFGYVFDDFGDSFIVNDPRGETPSRFLIEFVTNAKEAVVTCAEQAHHNLTDGDFVRFEEVSGMTELNGNSYEVSVINSYKFSIKCDTTNYHPYEIIGSGGYGNQIISPQTLKFKTFSDNLKDPQILDLDYCNFGRDRQVLLAFNSVHRWMDSNPNKLPTESDIDSVLKISNEINTESKIVDKIDEELIKLLVKEYKAEISPMAAIFGGIVGQEVLKSISGKFLPIQQIMTLSYIESLPDSVKCQLKGDRYDAYRIVFGNEQQDKMEQLRYFMIGAGAIGCEVLKNWALMGVGCSGHGKVIVTDMDRIEKSNLARQFLFRSKDIGKMKSEVACEAASKMNTSLKAEALTKCLEPESRDYFSDEFYDNLDGVCNALDNVKARLYSDSLCVYYKKPLLESGTLGPKASFQVVVPHLTESYQSSADPPEENIPACTLHNFPSIMDHCCLWGRDVFSGLFETSPEIAQKYIDNPDFIEQTRKQGNLALLDSLSSAYSVLSNIPKSFEDCAHWARLKFEELFNFKIRDLLHLYPKDHLTAAGIQFWSGSKRAPDPLEFDSTNPYHSEFIISASILYAHIFGITPGTNEDALKYANETIVPEWKPTDKEIPKNENEAEEKKEVNDNDPRIIELITLLQKIDTKGIQLHPEKFEKDDETNHHMDFIASASNLRALNYKIKTNTKLEIKRIAGKIIPAIATTTALVCGFICMEMYKVHNISAKKLSDFRSGFINLAISMFSLSEPISSPMKKFGQTGIEFSPLWDTLDISGDITIQTFINKVKADWGVRVMTMTIGKYLIYSSFMSAAKKKERMNKKITEVYEEVNKKPIMSSCRKLRLDCVCYNNDMDEVPSPSFMIFFRDEQ